MTWYSNSKKIRIETKIDSVGNVFALLLFKYQFQENKDWN